MNHSSNNIKSCLWAKADELRERIGVRIRNMEAER
jgi:hypothetical protein